MLNSNEPVYTPENLADYEKREFNFPVVTHLTLSSLRT